jgi:predicted dehydrogenase
MGNQGTANDGVRKAAALIRNGFLGAVEEVHVWTNRPVWPQGEAIPAPEPCPEHVKWDLWLGPAKYRPYAPGYHPFSWRGFWEFGTGALGDMACHTMNMPFMALDLRDPETISAQTAGHDRNSFPKWSIIKYEFPKTETRGPVTMYWYDGGKLPPLELLEGNAVVESGCLLMGEKGKLYSPNDYGAEFKILSGPELPAEVDFVHSPGHFDEWVQAMRGGPAAMSNFPDYAAPLTETVLLGNLAVWTEGKVSWRAKTMEYKVDVGVDDLLKNTYRKGYDI